jgi:Flp pilus assembly pilin Flp
MQARQLRREDGQTAAEYALILGGIALVVVALVLVLGVDVRDLFTSTGSSLPVMSEQSPPVSSGTFPTSIEQCSDPGFGTFDPPFASLEDCEDFVNNPP